ncbi:AraC family transcriptional regulator [Comamonas testosteroni]|uniref:NADP-dependent 3-hydroxy acid dehydrogenase YdfG n=1 Tax=Comamonas testosteroni TaxID=285 RepID=A0A0L7N8U9_COMTE|nr:MULTISPECIES: SDR family NAD(P)-dependent oxidoreductase [Comamonas]KOC30268.1 AraC family transcriptional regulator [Comamonas testosteroni]KWT73114.1 short chain dehydrogenase [Comamonas testosteroni]MDN5503924.1 SDR family NAD(P)-dependent oxidoreductase [Comamonas sp.]MDN5536815.1 SDR family NAD(P)-dependent oxidoreductase [Comamonas sp.]MPT10025.1 SDR family NAD(P)-dependent oxidoreductase [Comamonas sp.]
MEKNLGTAIVTGASSGIGAVYADRLAARGYDLVLIARRRERLEKLAVALRIKHRRHIEVAQADLANEADLLRVEALVSDASDVSFLINCAGSGALGMAAQVPTSAVAAMLKVNVIALTRLSMAAAKRFAAAKSGSIINIGSILALMPAPGASSYSGSKAYVLNFSRALQSELQNSGVRVQAVMPGPIRSEFFGDTPAPFPDQLFMSPETLVDTALAAYDQGEAVTFPNLGSMDSWNAFEQARSVMVHGVTQSGASAERYSH